MSDLQPALFELTQPKQEEPVKANPLPKPAKPRKQKSAPVEEEIEVSDLIPFSLEDESWSDIPILRDLDLYHRLTGAYSASSVFGHSQKAGIPRAQRIETPVEYDGKFYTSFGGSCAPGRGNSRNESITVWEANATRLFARSEYEGEPREHVENVSSSPLGYEGLVVIDPQGREWVVGKEEFTVQVFEFDNDFMSVDPEAEWRLHGMEAPLDPE